MDAEIPPLPPPVDVEMPPEDEFEPVSIAIDRVSEEGELEGDQWIEPLV